MKFIARTTIVVACVLLVVTLIDEIRDRQKYRLAQEVVAKYEGRFYSLPLWPFGAEYAVSIMNRELRDAELREIAQLDVLGKRGIYRRNFVSVYLLETNLGSHDLPRVQKLFPHSRVQFANA